MMSRKHFNEIARVLRENNAPLPLILDIARWLSTQNPRFDLNRFIEACKPVREAKAA